MIKVDALTVHEFRGIRDLTLDLRGQNFAICGPNGSGKSGVVDALEFVLTGTVSRLTGRGRGDLSLKEHGPHVDSRSTPERASLEALRNDETLLDGVVRDDMLRTALELFDGDACPVCDTQFTLADFREKILGKREKLAKVTEARNSAEKLLQPVVARFRDLQAKLRLCSAIGSKLDPKVDVGELDVFLDALEGACTQVASFLPVDATLAAVRGVRDDASKVNPGLKALTAAVSALPEPSDQDRAHEFLIVGDERLDAFRKAQGAHRAAQRRATRARAVFDLFVESTREALEQIYDGVQVTFGSFYRQLNSQDESSFEAKLKATPGRLGLDVDFYKRGFFPPAAFHSEGHQDSMGLCLYLALLRHLLGPRFQLAVLDDVLMSVDADHRREVCRLLITHFPETQFILTTHDDVWLRHMRTAGLIDSNGAMQFRHWTVERGPSVWNADIWAELEEKLANNDVSSAASLLRNYLEYLAREYCQDLRAKVEFRADGRHGLGDLLPPAIGRLRELLREARVAAESWSDSERVAKIKLIEAAFSSAVQATNVEQWQVNPAIHFNEWANLQRADFEPVVAAFKTLAASFSCTNCGGGIHVSPPKGSKEVLLCRCGTISFGFSKKPAIKSGAA